MTARTVLSHNGLPAESVATPNQTLYLTNLPDKLQKADLRLSLYTLFSTYGPVLDVVALKHGKMRGQAHIAFRDVQASTQAMRALQTFDFFGKEIRIQYGKGKSDAIAKLDGSYKMPVAVVNEITTTTMQQSIFNAPPSSLPAPMLAPKSKEFEAIEHGSANADIKEPKGVKRSREGESEDEEGEPMEEDSDAPMDASSDEDDD